MSEAFRYQNDQLYGENVPLAEVARRFGTPAYVYSRRVILENLERIRRGVAGLDALVCYSVKANSNLKILGLLREAGVGFDIVSGGELARVLRVGADPSSIVYSGVGKTQDEIDAGIQAGLRMFNVESAGELDLVEARARHAGRRAPIALRVNPDVYAETHPYIATGQATHKFGIPRQEALELYQRSAASRYLAVLGVACHIGSQILDVNPFLQALEQLLDIAKTLRAAGINVETLDLGGGFGIRYSNETPLDIEQLAGELTRCLRGMPFRLILEPGRALVAEAGILLTRVLYVKRNQRKDFVVVDAGMNDLMRPTLYDAYHEIVPVERREAEKLTADVVGPLCETGDFLAQDRVIPDVRPGDLLAVMTVGAYGFVLASNYNSRPRPAEVLIAGDQANLIRRRETLDDLMAAETI